MLITFTASSATINAKATLEECCELCGTEFVYSVEAVGTGVMVTPTWLDLGGGEIASSMAAGSLGRQMKRRAFVRCPSCMKFQPSLIQQRREKIQLVVLGLGALAEAAAIALVVMAYSSPIHAQSRAMAWVAVVVTFVLVAALAWAMPKQYDLLC